MLRCTVVVLLAFVVASEAKKRTFVQKHLNVKSGGEFEYIANKNPAAYGQPIATIVCDGGAFSIKLEGEELTKQGEPRVEFVTSAVPFGTPDEMVKMYTTLRNLVRHLGTEDFEDFQPDYCDEPIIHNAVAATGLRVVRFHSVQASLGLPILFFHNRIQQKFKAGGSFEEMGVMMGLNDIFTPNEKKNKKVTTTLVGSMYRDFLCNDKVVHTNIERLVGKPLQMTKESHPLLPKIQFSEDGDKLCDVFKAGFNANNCDKGTGYSGNPFPCFFVEGEDKKTHKIGSVGFVAEMRAGNKLVHFKACVSGFVNGGPATTFRSCLAKFTKMVNRLWDKVQVYKGTFDYEVEVSESDQETETSSI